MKKILPIFLLFNFYFLIYAAGAAPLTGGTYTIPSLTISSGGSNNLEGGTYKMMDIKGQAVIGSGTGGTYNIGLGGIYGEVVAGGGVEGEGVISWTTDPHVRNIRIRRASDAVGDAVVVQWDTDLAPGSSFYVWTKEGDFDNSPTAWSGPITVTTTSYSDANQVGRDPAQKYYRVISTTGSSGLLNMVAVGKYNVPVLGRATAVSFTIVSSPFEQTNNNWNQVVGNQLVSNTVQGDADQILKWTGSGWGGSIYLSPSGWAELRTDSGFNHIRGQGFVIRVPSIAGRTTRNITIVGKIATEEYLASDPQNFGANIATNLWTLIGPPYPKLFDWPNSGLKEAAGSHMSDVQGNADQVLSWTGDGWGGSMYLSTAGWNEMRSGSAFDFQPGLGFAYRRSGSPGTGVDWRLRL